MSNARFSVVPSKAVSDQSLTHAQFRTLSAIGCHGDKDGWCWPSHRKLAEILGKDERSVRKDVAILVKLGYLQKAPQYRKDGSQTSNRYRLVFDTPETDQEDDHGQDPLSMIDTPGRVAMDLPYRTPHKNAPLNAPKTPPAPPADPAPQDPFLGLPLPDPLGDSHREPLLDWLEYKRERRQTYKPRGLAALLNRVAKEWPDSDDLTKAVEHSIASNYSGLYAPPSNGNGSHESHNESVRKRLMEKFA